MTSAPERTSQKLYSPRLLALSASLADYPFENAHRFNAEARSRTCGSTIRLSIDCKEGEAISRIGMQVAACAVGQSSAAILARSIAGKTAEDIGTAVEQIERWLSDGGPLPDWPDFDALEAAKDHPGRHGAIQLPWKAALEALSSGSASG